MAESSHGSSEDENDEEVVEDETLIDDGRQILGARPSPYIRLFLTFMQF